MFFDVKTRLSVPLTPPQIVPNHQTIQKICSPWSSTSLIKSTEILSYIIVWQFKKHYNSTLHHQKTPRKQTLSRTFEKSQIFTKILPIKLCTNNQHNSHENHYISTPQKIKKYPFCRTLVLKNQKSIHR